jgi:hypothetical protein
MFRIHEPQTDHFARKLRADFERRMVDWLRSAYPSTFAEATDDDVAGCVSITVDKALRYGVTTEPEVAALMLVLMVLGPDADESTPWAREVLCDRRLTADGKVRALIAEARAHGVLGIEAVVLDDEPPAPEEGETPS